MNSEALVAVAPAPAVTGATADPIRETQRRWSVYFGILLMLLILLQSC